MYINVYIFSNNHNLLTTVTNILCLLATRNGIRRLKMGLLNYENSRLQVQNYFLTKCQLTFFLSFSNYASLIAKYVIYAL